MPAEAQTHWTDDDGQVHAVRWRSLAGHPPPQRMHVVDESLRADEACRLAREGVGLLWRGDYQNARQLLQAMRHRVDAQLDRRPPARARRQASVQARAPVPAQADQAVDLKQAFLAQRRAQAQRAQVLGMLLLPFDADHGVPLRRAPDVRAAGLEAHGVAQEHYVASLRELLGLIGAHEWRKKGVSIEALQARIHPHHGVFSPVRGEYVDLVARAPLPAVAPTAGAFDIGTGTGVLAAVLAGRGLRVTATEIDERALACAEENLQRLHLADKVHLRRVNLFPEGRAGLALCNPPWVPAQPHSPLEAAVYDPDSRMLRGYLDGLAAHLVPGGEGWLILSDFAERLGLRSRDELLSWIARAGLLVAGRIDTRPTHSRAADASDALHAARAAEVTSLWRLVIG